MYLKVLKPFFDIFFALVAFIFLLPVFLISALLLTLAMKGNPFFFQVRPGKKGQLFTIVKFKTMNDKKDEFGQLLPDAERLTAFGKFIRSTSIDEIPQLINVIKGDMSIVGPRPLLPEYLPLYNDFQYRRHMVKPGITGWAQVNGRNAISWKEKFELDIFYVQNVTFALDFKILIKTLQKVFKRSDITTQNQATAERFKGNES
ncbi:MAG: sugar transferase [Flavobacteriaceae bacterium]